MTETRVSCTMLWLATDPKLRPSRPSVFRVSNVSTLAHLEYASSGHQKPRLCCCHETIETRNTVCRGTHAVGRQPLNRGRTKR